MNKNTPAKGFTSVLMKQVNAVAAAAGNQLSNTDNEHVVDILNGTLTRIKDNNIDPNTIRFTECAFPSQVKRFARMGLSMSENHFYVDLRSNKNGGYDIGLWMQYQGEEHLLMEFCKKNGGVVNIYKDVVMDGEELVTKRNFKTGNLEVIDHKIPDVFNRNVDIKNKDKLVGAYAIAYHADGSQTAVIVDRVRIDRGYTAAKTKNIWNADYKAMVLKTAVHVLFKELRKFNEIPADLKSDYNEVVTGSEKDANAAVVQTATEVYEADITEVVDIDTGEVLTPPPAPAASTEDEPAW